MSRMLGRKPVLVPLSIVITGLLIMSAIFVYYGFHLGIKPCTGTPSDAANCGDADMGGAIFIFVGVPIALFGVVSLLAALALTFLRPHFNERYFLRTVYALFAALVAALAMMLFL